jgi:hypothetical protein
LQTDQNHQVIMPRLHHALFIVFALISSACEYFQPQEKIESKPIARAGELYLYADDLLGLTPENISKQDSARLAEKYINDWIKKQLIVEKARTEIAINEAEIERKVLEYQYALISHEFEKLYISAHLDNNVSQEEVEAYYTSKADNFILKQNIVRCLFVQVPKSAPAQNQLRRNLRSYPNANMTDIKDYSYQYATKSFLDDSVWVNFDEVIKNTPLKTIDNRTQYLKRTTFSESADENYSYYIKIVDYKISDQVSPLEFIREDIENIIINKRKLALKKELEKAIYEEATVKKNFEIFSN